MKTIQITFLDQAQLAAFEDFLKIEMQFPDKLTDVGMLAQILTQIKIQS